jgi:hypothetical protein
MLTSLVALLFIQGGQANDSLLAKIVPQPTGKNGYEDYLHAGDLAGGYLWPMYEQMMGYRLTKIDSKIDPDDEQTLPPVAPGTSLESTDLAIRIAANDHVGGAFDVVELGNTKQVYDPRQALSSETLFPEMARFKMLAKIGTNKAYVEFAEGKTSVATKDLLEGLKFSKNIFGSVLISGLVSIAMQAIFLAEFNRHLGQLSLSDAQLIDKTCKYLIDTPYPVREMFQREFQMTSNSIDQIIDKPEEILSEDENRAFGSALSSLGPSDKALLKGFLIQTLSERYGETANMLGGPEANWPVGGAGVDPIVSTQDKSVSNLTILLANELHGKNSLRQYTTAMAKARIQIRLLQLHAKVIEYRWQNGSLPRTIEDFADAKTATDPFAGTPFHYEVKDGNYRLYSTGIPGIGQIELKYRLQGALAAATDADHP